MNRLAQIIAGVIGVALLVSIGLGIYWSHEPGLFDPIAESQQDARERGRKLVPGYSTVYTLTRLTTILLEKPGGFIANDKMPPGLWMDNMPNFEDGAIFQIRDMARVLRNDWSRSQSQSQEDQDLVDAQNYFFHDTENWILPAAEDKYRDGIKSLNGYLTRISDPTRPGAQLFARADNLNEWLGEVQKRLGDLTQRLSLSVGKRQLNLDLAGEPDASSSTTALQDTFVSTSWTERDDVFYEARGQSWALIHLLKAAEKDFGSVLEKKNARISLRQIIRELEPTQDALWSPFILNGDGLGLLANHSVYLGSYLSRANAAIIELRELMEKG